MPKPKVALLVGSDSDIPTMREGIEVLKKLQISYELHIYSAHRTPDQTLRFAQKAHEQGFRVIIAGAGMAAHLAGVVASHTLLPVIGVPIEGKLQGLDSLLSTVQMPKGVPVGTVAIGKTGAVNAALLAAQILALSDEELLKRIGAYRFSMGQEVLNKDKELQGNARKFFKN
ncbi:MAG: 5-(carboxyamino)imidazole ribonucleotide mutase [Deltaproteobacteria bacterium]|nr:5-(carboxyamino)imidazole ribonucleotide mutase [Deltaproteobacteria bacterium]